MDIGGENSRKSRQVFGMVLTIRAYASPKNGLNRVSGRVSSAVVNDLTGIICEYCHILYTTKPKNNEQIHVSAVIGMSSNVEHTGMPISEINMIKIW